MADREKAPGAVRQITSLTNPIVKDIRALAMKKAREPIGEARLNHGLITCIECAKLAEFKGKQYAR